MHGSVLEYFQTQGPQVIFLSLRRFCQRATVAVRKVVIPKTRLIIVSGVNPDVPDTETNIGVEFDARFVVSERSAGKK